MAVNLAELESAVAKGSVNSAEYGRDTTFPSVIIGDSLIMAQVPPDRLFLRPEGRFDARS